MRSFPPPPIASPTSPTTYDYTPPPPPPPRNHVHYPQDNVAVFLLMLVVGCLIGIILGCFGEAEGRRGRRAVARRTQPLGTQVSSSSPQTTAQTQSVVQLLQSSQQRAPISNYRPSLSEPIECSICFDEMKQGQLMTVMSLPRCNHRFHTYCINQWINVDTDNRKQKCPLCRASISG
ncbi:hypothetical protein IFM89_007690 [Coptis chinensis]|uniref:RING-type domain-containing protein n=1 Tax=Coptis chinensis TaxID=261450 RepID=A0A835MBY0_9MAGN|nr:hypothetical protein IFM89_007690 [Coptis chinensis]